MNLAVKFNLLKDTQPHYIYKPESCLENDNYNSILSIKNGNDNVRIEDNCYIV
jgi:hypothetical protein